MSTSCTMSEARSHTRGSRLLSSLVAVLLCVCSLHSEGRGETFYCDPVGGSTTEGNGSLANPWGTLQSVFGAGLIQRRKYEDGQIDNASAPVGSGDTIRLLTGYHGYIDYDGWFNDEGAITIEAAPDHHPKVGRFRIDGACHWALRGLDICPEYASAIGADPVRFTGGTFGGCRNITVDSCRIYGVTDATAATWDRKAYAEILKNAVGVYLLGEDSLIKECTIKYARRGILPGGNRTRVVNNTITHFIGDGLRHGGGSDVVYEGNLVMNPLAVDNDHRDGLQVFAKRGTISGLVIRGNRFISWTDPDIPFVASFQGIFANRYAEASYTGWTVENNEIINSHAHGITIHGTEMRIINNTLVKVPGGEYWPGITITGGVVRNNIAGGIPPSEPPRRYSDHNLVIDSGDVARVFVDYEGLDLRLKDGSPAIAAGTAEGAPDTDIEGLSRSTPVDIGCHAYGAAGLVLTTIADKQIEATQRLEFTVTATGSEGPVSYSATGTPFDLGASFNGQRFTWEPDVEQLGSYEVTFVASDGTDEDSQTVTITVLRPNNAPQLASITDTSTHENMPLSFSVSATDPDGDSISYSAQGLPAGASFTGQLFNWTPTYSQAGEYEVTFVASDGRAQDARSVQLKVVNVNRPPVFSAIGDRSVDENTPLELILAATDPDGDPLTYSVDGLPSGAELTDATLQWTPAPGQAGSYELLFTASDGESTDSQTATILVAGLTDDQVPPTVARQSPVPDAIQVPLNNLIRLHVSDAGRGVDPETVRITLNDSVIYQGDVEVYTSAGGHCRRAGTRNDYQFVYQPHGTFDFDRTMTVQVRAADLAGNTMPERAYSFATEMRIFGRNRTISGPEPAAPAGGAVTAAAGDGTIWTVWHAGPEGGRAVYVAKSAAGGPGSHAFEAPVQLSVSAGDQCHPDLAVGPDGACYIVWQDNRNGNWDIFASICSDGTNFSRAIPVTDSDGNETHPVIALETGSGGDGSPYVSGAHVAWQDDRNGNEDIYLGSSDTAFAATTVSQVTSGTGSQIEPAIAVDGQKTVYLVWTSVANGEADIHGAASDSGPWTNLPIVVKPGDQTAPALAIEPGGTRLHLVWEDDVSGDRDVYYLSSEGLPGGPLAGRSIVDDSSGADQRAPRVVCGGEGKVFACWQDARHVARLAGDTDIYFVELSEGSDGVNILVGDDHSATPQSEPTLGVQPYGQPYVIWTDHRVQNAEIYYAATTYIDPNPTHTELVKASEGATVGAEPSDIEGPEDISIVVPAGACRTDVNITVSRVLNPQLSFGLLSSFDLGPSGIDFDLPVTVTIPYRVAAGSGSALPYWYDALTGAMSQQGITDIEDVVLAPDLHAIRFRTTHFTPYYVVEGSVSQGLTDTSNGAAAGGAGCSLSAMGGGSPVEFALPYGLVAVAMAVLRRRDRKTARGAASSNG